MNRKPSHIGTLEVFTTRAFWTIARGAHPLRVENTDPSRQPSRVEPRKKVFLTRNCGSWAKIIHTSRRNPNTDHLMLPAAPGLVRREIVISVAKDGVIAINQQRVEAGALPERLADLYRRHINHHV